MSGKAHEVKGKREGGREGSRTRQDHYPARQLSFDPSPAHADCAEAYTWGAQIRHIAAAQTLNGLTLCAQRGIVTLTHSYPLLSPLDHTKPRGVASRNANRTPEIFSLSLWSLVLKILPSRGAAVEFLTRRTPAISSVCIILLR